MQRRVGKQHTQIHREDSSVFSLKAVDALENQLASHLQNARGSKIRQLNFENPWGFVGKRAGVLLNPSPATRVAGYAQGRIGLCYL